MHKFSIIIPFYKVPRLYFKQCIDSVLAQTYKDFELILVSDGACKESLDICHEYVIKDNRIRVVEQFNQGVSTARNHGIEEATGQWIMFIDADDWIDKTTLERYNKYIKQTNADYIFSGFYKEFSNKQVDVYSHRYQDIKFFEGEEGMLDLQKMILAAPMYGDSGMRATMYRSVCSGVFCASLLKDNNIRFDDEIKLDEDLLFRINVAVYSRLTVYVNEMFYHYRAYGSSASVYFRNDYVENLKKAIRKLGQYLTSNSQISFLLDDYNYRILEVSNSFAVNFFFNKNNDCSWKEKNKNAKLFFDSPFFRDALTRRLCRKLPFKRKVQLFLLKHHLFYFYRFFYGGYTIFVQRKRYA